jgi:hypothetical protein
MRLCQKSGNDVTPEGREENVITVMEAANMVQNLWGFITTTKDVPDCMLESNDILQEIMTKTGCAEKNYRLFS